MGLSFSENFWNKLSQRTYPGSLESIFAVLKGDDVEAEKLKEQMDKLEGDMKAGRIVFARPPGLIRDQEWTKEPICVRIHVSCSIQAGSKKVAMAPFDVD